MASISKNAMKKQRKKIDAVETKDEVMITFETSLGMAELPLSSTRHVDFKCGGMVSGSAASMLKIVLQSLTMQILFLLLRHWILQMTKKRIILRYSASNNSPALI